MDEFDCEIFNAAGQCVGIWHIVYDMEASRFIPLYPALEKDTQRALGRCRPEDINIPPFGY